MREVSLAIAGTGGQGVVFASSVLARALFRMGYYVAQLQSYGAEVRGGAVVGWVVYSEGPIACPFVEEFDVLVALHQAGLDECARRSVRGRLTVVDESLVRSPPPGALKAPFHRVAEGSGLRGLENVVALGALAGLGFVGRAELEAVLREGPGSEANLRALRAGLELASRLAGRGG